MLIAVPSHTFGVSDGVYGVLSIIDRMAICKPPRLQLLYSGMRAPLLALFVSYIHFIICPFSLGLRIPDSRFHYPWVSSMVD